MPLPAEQWEWEPNMKVASLIIDCVLIWLNMPEQIHSNNACQGDICHDLHAKTSVHAGSNAMGWIWKVEQFGCGIYKIF